LIKIITDTTACLPFDFAHRLQISVIPQVIVFGSESFYEGIQLDNASFMRRLKNSSEIPKTSAPPPDLFIDEFSRLVESGNTILCIHPSSEVSGTVRSATVAANEFPGADIRIIDSRVIGTPIGTMVQLAAEWATQGVDADTIVARLQKLIQRCRVYFLVPTLDYLARGGRIGGAQALLGSVLQIKPILTVHDGHVDRYENERTQKRALARLKRIVTEQISNHSDGEGYLTVMHAGVPEQGEALASELGALMGIANIPVADVPPAIVVHGGPGILAVAFFVKEN
jgi:DegV family protein with EDD domain